MKTWTGTHTTVPKWVLIVRPKIPQMPQNLSAKIVCRSPKVWDFDTKRASLGVRSPCRYLTIYLAGYIFLEWTSMPGIDFWDFEIELESTFMMDSEFFFCLIFRTKRYKRCSWTCFFYKYRVGQAQTKTNRTALQADSCVRWGLLLWLHLHIKDAQR